MKVKAYTIDLSEQMAVCDANYIRLLKLLGKTRAQNTKRVINLPQLGRTDTPEQITVSLEVLEDFKYTSTIVVRQLAATADAKSESFYYNAPEMVVRVYHDAKTAEVVSFQNHKYFKAIYSVPNQYMYQRDEKEQLNLFLAEWLNMCINEGLGSPDELQLERLTSL